MHKGKNIAGYIISFFLTILLVILFLLGIMKTTVLNENYVIKIFEKNNYYKLISDKIKENMEDYMRSSGLDKEILDNLFTEEDVKNDVKKYLDKIYKDEKIEFNDSILKEKLSKNIEELLAKQNLVITDKNAIDSFVSEMVKIYQNETNLYNLVDDYIEPFQKVINISNIAFIGILIISILLLILVILMKIHCLGTVTLASGLMLIFVRFVIYEKIDFKNLLIISDEFSKILNKILTNIANLIAIYAGIFIVLGLILALAESFMAVKKRRRRYKKSRE